MKKKQLIILYAIVCSLFLSCHKPGDIPGGKACQIVKVHHVYTDREGGITLVYTYNNKRLLDTLKIGPDFSYPNPFGVLQLAYNSQSKPVSISGSGTNVRFIYKNGRIVRVERLLPDNIYHEQYSFFYDSRDRVITRSSPYDTTRYEYEDNSRNFKKRTHYDVGTPADQLTINEYQYDAKINPLSAWPNLSLNPLDRDLPDRSTNEYEPITDNNLTYQSAKGRYNNGYFTYQEVFYVYTYDNMYPNQALVRDVHHSPGNPDDVRLSQTIYTYDCASKGTSF